MGLRTEILDRNDIVKIRSLWEKLNARHLEVSNNFKRHYREQTFEKRCAKFYAVPEDRLRIEAAYDDGGSIVGYCICSIGDGAGELDSIYVEPQSRGKHIGAYLAGRGIEWMKQKGCEIICVGVADGNEDVLPFYESLGFAKRMSVLQLK